MEKVIQIEVSPRKLEGPDILYALTNEGNIYKKFIKYPDKDQGWVVVSPITQL